MILYFTGTGNSRYVAEMLADKLNDEIVSINDCVKNGSFGEYESEKPYVFVSPVYVAAPPKVLMDFVRNSEFKGSKAAYFVFTCAGGFGGAPGYAKKLAHEKNFVFMGANQVFMPQNYMIFFKTKDKETNLEIVKQAKPQIEQLAELIARGAILPDPGMTGFDYVSTAMVLDPYYKFFMKANKFAADDKCISCGKCAKVCPLNNITLKDGKPTWDKNCTHCMACISYCPVEAIQFGKTTVGKPRHICPSYIKEQNIE